MNATQLSLDDALDAFFQTAKSALSKLRKDEIRYLTGPIVYHPGGWGAGEILPKLVPAARLELLLSGERELATLEETLAYLASASMCFPLAHEDAELMFWLMQEVSSKHNLSPEPVWQVLAPERGRPFEMSDYLRRERLDPLRRKIRAAVVRHSRAADGSACRLRLPSADGRR